MQLFSKNVPIGKHDGRVEITATVEDDGTHVVRRLPFSAQIVADVQAHPSQVHFGVVSPNETTEETLTLRSLTNSTFRVIGARASGSGLSVEAITRQGAVPQFTSYLVRLTSIDAGNQSGTVVFSLEGPNGALSDLSVPVRYYGHKPEKDAPG